MLRDHESRFGAGSGGLHHASFMLKRLILWEDKPAPWRSRYIGMLIDPVILLQALFAAFGVVVFLKLSFKEIERRKRYLEVRLQIKQQELEEELRKQPAPVEIVEADEPVIVAEAVQEGEASVAA